MAINFKQAAEKRNSEDSGQNKDFKPVPQDRYIYEIDKAELATASTGRKNIEVQFSIAEGKYQNRKVWRRFYLTDKAMPYLVEFMEVLESDLLQRENVDENEVVDEINNTSKKVSAYTSIETVGENDEKKINTVAFFQSVGSSPTPSLVEDEPESDADLFT